MARRQKKHVRTRDPRQRSAKVIAPVPRSGPSLASVPAGQSADRQGDSQAPKDENPAGQRVVLAPRDVAEDWDCHASGRASLDQFDATFFSREPDYGPRDLDSWPPTAEDAGDAIPILAPPYVLARRSVYRRVVGVVLAAAILVLVTGLGLQVASRAPAQGSVAGAVPSAR
jgi:hypothetical protein